MGVVICKTIIILFAIANVTAIALALIEANAKSTIVVEKKEDKHE